jgi:hypothetical protein
VNNLTMAQDRAGQKPFLKLARGGPISISAHFDSHGVEKRVG